MITRQNDLSANFFLCEGLAPITSLTVCHIIEDQLLFIFIFRELQQPVMGGPVIHDIELAFEPPLYILGHSLLVGQKRSVLMGLPIQ